LHSAGGKEGTKRVRFALAESDRCAAELQERFEGAHRETIRGMGDWLEESK